MSERSAKVDNRYVVRSIIGHDDLSPVGRPRECKGPRLAVGIVGSDLDPSHLSVRRAHAREIHVDDGDRVPLEVDIGPFASSDGDEFAIRTCLDAERAGLDRNPWRDFDYRDAGPRVPST